MGTDKEIGINNPEPPSLIPSTRFTLACLVFMAFITQYSQRVNFPIAIVCMVNRTKISEYPAPCNRSTFTWTNRTALTNHTNFSIATDCQTNFRHRTNPTSEPSSFFRRKQFRWFELEQQILLGSYWAGYIFTQIPGSSIL